MKNTFQLSFWKKDKETKAKLLQEGIFFLLQLFARDVFE